MLAARPSLLDGEAQAAVDPLVVALDGEPHRLEPADLVREQRVRGILGEPLALGERDQVADV
jgi:hypothetical protein